MKKPLFILLALIFCITTLTEAAEKPTQEEKEFYEYLYRLAYEGKLDSIKYILENQKVDLSRYDKDSKYFTPIIYAATWNGNKDVIEYLISKGADPKAKTSGNETALHRAAWNGNLDLVKLFVEHGADLNIIYNANGGLSPLCCAAESGNIEVVKYLIEKGAKINYTNQSSGASPLRSAAYEAHYDIFLLLAKKQPVSYDWQEALFYGLIGGNLDIVKYIVEKKGANVNRKSKIWREYPIQKAAADRFVYKKEAQPVEVVKYLISKGARLSDINNGQVFEWAMEHSTEAMMEFLLDQGIKINIPPSTDGWTPLAMALDNGNFVLAKRLIKTTKDYTFRGMPLVIYFSDGMYNSSHIIDLLIKEGVNKEHYDKALVNSVSYSDSASIQLLLQAGANIKQLNTDGSNLLHLAYNHVIAKLLIEKGVDTENEIMLNNAWKNPDLLQALDEINVVPPIAQDSMNIALALAAQTGDRRTVEYMLRRGADVNFQDSFVHDDDRENSDYQKYIDLSEEQEEQERYYLNQMNQSDGYKQTPLIRNAIQGYSHCRYGNYRDKNSKIQVSGSIAKILLEAGADPNLTDSRGRTALHYVSGDQSCRIGIWPIPMGNRRDREHGAHGDPAMPPSQYHDSVALLLIGYGANLNIKDKNGNTPLILAALNRNHGMLKTLLEAGADVNIKNEKNKDVFSYLDDEASFQVIKDAGLGERISDERLNIAFRKFFTDYRSRSEYDVKELRALISYGANVNTKMYPNDSTNALMYTFDRMYGDNKFEIAQILVDNGINLYAEDQWGYTLPMILIKRGKEGESYSNDKSPVNLDFLVKNNIDLNHKGKTQFTALAIAICEDKPETTAYLLKHGAKRDRQAEWWYLMKERYYDSKTIPMLRKLVKEGVDVNTQASEIITVYVPKVKQTGVTALMLFAAYGKEDGVKALLELGADVNIKAADGTTALDIAKDRRKQEIVDLLLKAGAKE